MGIKNLPEFVEVAKFYRGHYTNVMHMQLHTRLYEFITAQDKTKLHLTDALLKRWQSCIDVETELCEEAKVSEQTAKVLELDQKRDDRITYFFNMVRSQLKAPDEPVKKAAETVMRLLKVYVGIQSETLEAESGHITGLLKDAEKCAAEVTTLGLTATLDTVKQLNEDLGKVMNLRRHERAEKQLPTSDIARPQTDREFDLVRRNIEAAFLYEKEADKPMILTLVNNIDGIIAEFEQRRKAEEKATQQAAANALEKARALLAPLLEAFEVSNHFAAGSVKFADRMRTESNRRFYAFTVQGKDELIWASVRNGLLVKKVERPTVQPNKNGKGGKKGGAGKNGGKKPGDDNGGGTGNSGGGNGGSNPGGNKPGGSGQGSATVTPKE